MNDMPKGTMQIAYEKLVMDKLVLEDKVEKLQAENKDLKENMTKHTLNYRKGKIKQLQTELDKVKKKARLDYNFIYNQLITLQKGYKKLIQAEVDKYRWIPVSERLPEKNECDDVLFVIEHLVEGGEFKNGLFWDNNGRSSQNEEITHWKPIILPEGEEVSEEKFLTQEERIAAYRKSVGDKWDEERECWVSISQ